ncbi:hypothetical protein CYMTET_53559 [Cymbomonas tetramitiformis]|uniref:Uncharacterized protein n=1 Tax=Cymbomonas tetramitiformis TaxID=36881 RepID=A0AAE0BGL2_9CHLO|nr:hypothetical protein CYMTET_53559 [Cymbomonas tetramitiformis]
MLGARALRTLFNRKVFCAVFLFQAAVIIVTAEESEDIKAVSQRSLKAFWHPKRFTTSKEPVAAVRDIDSALEKLETSKSSLQGPTVASVSAEVPSRDFPDVSYAVWVSASSAQEHLTGSHLLDGIRGLPGVYDREVVLWFDGPAKDVKQEAAQAASLWATLRSENHFMLYSSSVDGEVRAFNRMIKFSQNAKLVVLLRDVDIPLISDEWMQRASKAFETNPGLAILGGGAGKVEGKLYGAGGAAVSSGFMLAEEISGGPLVVHRQHMLTLGLFALLGCPDDCATGFEAEISTRAWLAGYQVGLAPVATAPSAACSDNAAQVSGPFYNSADLKLVTAALFKPVAAPPALQVGACSELRRVAAGGARLGMSRVAAGGGLPELPRVAAGGACLGAAPVLPQGGGNSLPRAAALLLQVGACSELPRVAAGGHLGTSAISAGSLCAAVVVCTMRS